MKEKNSSKLCIFRCKGFKICKNKNFLNIKIFLNLFILFILLINSVHFVNGFGISMSYDDKDRPLIINPGEEKEVGFYLLSSARESNKRIRLDIIEGGEIASLDKNEFELPSDGEVKGFIKVKANGFEKRKEALITLLIKEISNSDEGTVGFSFSSKFSFIVKIKEFEEKPTEKFAGKTAESKINSYVFLFIILILMILFLIVFIYFLLKRRKPKSKSRNVKF